LQHPISLVISESSQVGGARRLAAGLAAALDFGETRQGQLALVVTEIGNNLVRHASYGELFIRAVEADGDIGLEIIAVDKGPGIANLGQCMRDGYSTAGTAGNGLGAIARLSQHFEVYSLPGGGTVLLSQVWAKSECAPPDAAMVVGVVARPKPGQEVCGDSWAAEHLSSRSLYFLADGLGHGPDAAIASQEAVRAFRKNKSRRPKEILEAVHAALVRTRGVAAAVAEIHFDRQEVCFAGVGNIAATIVDPVNARSLVSYNGIVGHQVRKIQEFTYSWSRDALLVLHSDGLSSRWQVEHYSGLIVRHPALIAGVLYRDFQRDNDDATVLVARNSHDMGRP